ncbi:kinase-like domain-containing protein [Mycena olivaceomarginata]|nr:kinase-like domain-containing protein [Mycena olivaceomarginata]
MSPSIYRRNTADVVISLGKTAAQITAQFAPVPGMGPVADLICGIIQLCQNVTQNRNAAFQLRDRCHRLGLVVYDKTVANENVAAAIQSVTQCLQQIQTKMTGWVNISKVQGFLHQGEIAKDIEVCHSMLSDCVASFQFKLDTEEDHRELVAYLVDIQNSQEITNDILKIQTGDIQQMMRMMQQMMGNNLRTANQQHNGLSSNLYDLQFKSGELLPDFNLRSGEVIRVGQFPVSGTSAMDIYEGLYLGREKVAIKVEDGPFPYMVSPWQPNGTALTYVKREGDKVDYLKAVLHSMAPQHVVHGDIKASNVVINGRGQPLIADFGLSRIVEDITGIPFSQSRGVSDSYRWFAPEVCIGQGVLSLSSDVYAYGMTILEIFTHEQPYNNIKHTTEVVIRSAKGEHPPRPADPKVLARGLDDKVWELLGPLLGH